MENNENNNLNELNQLKAQYETLKEQFDQQEIVNDRLMKSSVKQGTDFYRHYRLRNIIMYPLVAIFGLFFAKELFDNSLSIRLFVMSFCLACLVIELWMTKKIQNKVLENNNLLNLAHWAQSYRKLFSVFTILNYSTGLILTFGCVLALLGEEIRLPNMTTIIVMAGFVLLFFIFLGTAEIRYKTRPCDEIIRQIEASDDTLIKNKKTGFTMKQKLFCTAMLVMFIGFDIWAYTIVGTYLKLPPMWRQVTYTRTGDSFPVDDGLSIWEVFADTVLSTEDVPALTELWQEDPSLVVAKGADSNGKSVQLYALRMASPEGPMVSSARIGGKPVVEKVVLKEPYLNNEDEAIPLLFYLTPEAKQLWSENFNPNEEVKSIDIAFVVDGVVYWKTNFTSLQGVVGRSFFIKRKWSSKEELDDFCKRLVHE